LGEKSSDFLIISILTFLSCLMIKTYFRGDQAR
jgi:hypothetical protein